MERVLKKPKKALEKPFPLALVLRNVFVFCGVVEVELFRKKESHGYLALEELIGECCLLGLTTSKPKSVHSAIRRIVADWPNVETRKSDPEIYSLIVDNKFPDKLYKLREYVQRDDLLRQISNLRDSIKLDLKRGSEIPDTDVSFTP